MVHRVALALSDGVPIFELAAPCAIFGTDRSDLAGTDWYSFAVCGPAGVQVDRWFVASTQDTYESLVTADTVIVPACHDEMLTPPTDLVEAVRAAHENGARVASICTGAFVLAAAGLLNGRRAATHWMHAPTLARRHPAVQVDAAPLYVDEGDVLTSAGKSAGVDLCLHIVRKDYGAEVANRVARVLVAPPHRAGHQRQYAQPLELRSDVDSFGATLDWARRNLDRSVTVDQLAQHASVSVRTLHRHFLARVGVKPLTWLNDQRIRQAQQLLETTDSPIERIADACGFGSAAVLRRRFRESLQTSPDAYRRTFSSPAAQPGD